MDLFQHPIDPIVNTTLTNAFYVNHLYGNLISVDETGVYKPDLASSFYWEGEKLVFEFERSSIDSSDAEFSIRRAVLNGINDHANLSYLVCKNINSEQECLENIYSQSGKLYIKVFEEKNRELIIPVLSALNYKIVPVKAFDKKDYRSSQIVDYSYTSGHYYLRNQDITKLYANKYTIEKFSKAPSQVLVVNTNSQDIIEKISKKEIDVISTTVPILEEVAIYLRKEKWNIFSTYPISIVFAVFNDSFMKKTKIEERFYIADRFYSELKKSRFYESTNTLEFLQQFGEGYLNPEQKEEVLFLRQSKDKKTSEKIIFGVKTPERWTELSNIEGNLKVVKLDKPAVSVPESQRPDVYIISNDVSFDASFTMFSFAVKSGFFIYENKSKEQIIEEFISQKTAQDRIEYLNKVHFYSLKNCKIYPFWASPYTTAARPGIEVNMSKYNSRTLLWNLKID